VEVDSETAIHRILRIRKRIADVSVDEKLRRYSVETLANKANIII